MAVAGAAALLTPIATPANLIVMNPGGYRFGDYWRLGAVVMVTWLVLALTVIPVFWPCAADHRLIKGAGGCSWPRAGDPELLDEALTADQVRTRRQ